MTAKEKHKQRMLEYWGNPENDFITRQEMYLTVLRVTRTTFYKHFPSAELFHVEAEASALRRVRSARQRTNVLAALYSKAKEGDVPAVREFLDRTEGTVAQRMELTGKDGKELLPSQKIKELSQDELIKEYQDAVKS